MDDENKSRAELTNRQVESLGRELEAKDREVQKWRSLIQNSPNLVTIVNGDHAIEFINHPVSGLTSDEVLGKSVYDFIQPEFHDLARQCIEHIFETGARRSYTSQATGPDDSIAWYENKLGAIEMEGEVIGVSITAIDITRQKREEELQRAHGDLERQVKERTAESRHQEELFGNLADISPVGIYRTDVSGHCHYVNRRWCEIAGLSAQEAQGKGWAQGLHPDDKDRVFAEWNRTIGEGSLFRAEYRFRRKEDEQTTWVLGNAAAERNEAGEIVGYIGTITDITERKQAEEDLAFQASLLDQVHNGVIVIDFDHKILYWNQFAQELYQWSSAEALGRDIVELLSPEEMKEKVEKNISSLKREGHWEGEFNVKRKDGSLIPARIVNTYLKNASGEPIGFIGISSDLTEHRKMEEDLRRIHNLESLGLLAGGIAHDFNNVLTGVLGNLALLETMSEEGSEQREIAQNARQAAEKTRALTGQLMTFARGGAPVKETLPMAELVREAVELSLRGSKTRPEYRFAENILSANVDKGQIGQVVQNLVLNADQAMPMGGVLTVGLEKVEIVDGSLLPLPAGAYIKVSVEDRGTGIPDNVLDRVFDPYFTTKAAGHGLGLSISHSIISRHEGHIRVRSQQGEGTTFDFYLPAAERETPPAAESRREAPRGSGRILLLDDEEVIHQVVGRILTTLGYEVDSACDGDEALQAYKTHLNEGTPYDIVIADLTIPGGRGGSEIIAELQELNSQVRVVVASGYSNDPVMANYAAYGFVGRLTKPIGMGELADLMRDLLKKR